MFRLSSPRAVLTLFGCLAMASGAYTASAADPVQVNVPAMTQWCLARPAALTDLANPSFRQAEIGEVMLAVGKAGVAISVPDMGVPFVDRTDRIDDQNVNMTYCVNMDTTKSPSAESKITARKRAALKAVGKSCDGQPIDACEADLIAALQGAPWNLPPNAPADLVHFVADVPATGPIESRIVAAVNSAHSHFYDPVIGLVIVKPVTGPQGTMLALGLP